MPNFPNGPLTRQPKQVQDIKKFLEVARRKDATRKSALQYSYTPFVGRISPGGWFGDMEIRDREEKRGCGGGCGSVKGGNSRKDRTAGRMDDESTGLQYGAGRGDLCEVMLCVLGYTSRQLPACWNSSVMGHGVDLVKWRSDAPPEGGIAATWRKVHELGSEGVESGWPQRDVGTGEGVPALRHKRMPQGRRPPKWQTYAARPI